jgi:hypothetical protein
MELEARLLEELNTNQLMPTSLGLFMHVLMDYVAQCWKPCLFQTGSGVDYESRVVEAAQDS